jgi:hypothetical protein
MISGAFERVVRFTGVPAEELGGSISASFLDGMTPVGLPLSHGGTEGLLAGGAALAVLPLDEATKGEGGGFRVVSSSSREAGIEDRGELGAGGSWTGAARFWAKYLRCAALGMRHSKGLTPSLELDGADVDTAGG